MPRKNGGEKMRLRALIAALSLLLVAIAIPATVSSAWSPGCPAATHRSGLKVPADGGSVYKPRLVKKNGISRQPPIVGPVIAFIWTNNENPSVLGMPWNSGNPPWGMELRKVLVPPGVKVRFVGMGGEWWDYKNRPACRTKKFLRGELANSPQIPLVPFDDWVAYGIIRLE